MLRETFIITFDAGKDRCEDYLSETKIGQSEEDVIDSIILGDCPLPYRQIYRVALGEVTEDVTDRIAEQVWRYSLRKPISTEAKHWLDWAGYDIDLAAE
jgi:hypothetical protein